VSSHSTETEIHSALSEFHGMESENHSALRNAARDFSQSAAPPGPFDTISGGSLDYGISNKDFFLCGNFSLRPPDHSVFFKGVLYCTRRGSAHRKELVGMDRRAVRLLRRSRLLLWSWGPHPPFGAPARAFAGCWAGLFVLGSVPRIDAFVKDMKF